MTCFAFWLFISFVVCGVWFAWLVGVYFVCVVLDWLVLII